MPAVVPVVCLCFAVSWLGLSTGAAGADATIEGRVPVAPRLPAPRLDESYLRTLSGPVAEPEPPVSAVWLTPLDAAPPATPPAETAGGEMTQRGFQFRPGLLVVPVGATVRFPNRDDAYHSIFSYSDPKRFDLGRYLGDDDPPAVTFDRPGLVRLFCEIHEHMRGAVLVVDAAHYTVSDPAGDFRLDGVPPGRYRVHVWVDPKRTLTRDVELAPGRTLRLDLDGAQP
jgi:plastocyanin